MRLRQVIDDDLPVFFEQQRDAEASEMAGVPMRERADFDTRWAALLVSSAVVVRTIEVEDGVAGFVFSFPMDGELRLGYWLGRAYWGCGIASEAVAEFLAREQLERPIYATVSPGNTASVRILEKLGFRTTEGGTKAALHLQLS